MTSVYLIRHGQAGTRNRYDTLSALGREQSRRLGQSLASQGVRFTAALCGGLERQRETSEEVKRGYAEAGVPFPEVVADAGWSEFDLDAVYADMAPALAAADPVFRAAYEEMLSQMADEEHEVHRRWSPCDLAVLRAWVSASVPVKTAESWVEFQARVEAALARLERWAPGESVAVFTSATPIGITCGNVLGVAERTRIRLTGALYNSAYTTLHRRDGEWSLFSFNNVPHLMSGDLRSFR